MSAAISPPVPVAEQRRASTSASPPEAGSTHRLCAGGIEVALVFSPNAPTLQQLFSQLLRREKYGLPEQ